MKRLALIFSFIFVVIHAYSAFKTKELTDSIALKNQTFTSSNISDSLALVALYNQCNGPNWTKKDNWLTGRLDTWQGVIVENGRVVKLDLFDNPNSIGLKGLIPFELSNLTDIRSLDLRNNKLSGSLPEGWSNLVKLQYLDLSLNQLTGSLPENWSSLIQLQTLSLNYNQLTGTLPDKWGSLMNLIELNLFGNQLTGSLPVGWSTLSKLTQIELGNNQLSGSLPDSWSAISNLLFLNISVNKLTGTLPESWSTFTKITRLYISHNQISGSLPKSWSALNNIIELGLFNNQITGSLPESWSALRNLSFLLLFNNQITGSYPQSWSTLVNLQDLRLNNNQISFLPALSTYTKLNILSLENNQLDFGSLELNVGIPKATYSYSPQAPIGPTYTITKNTGEECKISVTVGGQSNKYQWYKNGVLITGATSAEYVIPSVIIGDAGIYTCNITNTVATQLTLSSNPITLQVINDIYNLYTDSLALVALYNQCNGPNWTRKKNWLTGRLVTWQGVFLENGRVIGLILSDNSNPENSVGLTGNLPAELTNLTAIQFLNFRNNQLTGNLPESWSVFKNLKSLYLHENQFSGILPECWSAMESLSYLGFDNNNLTGTLPTTWSALQNLEIISLNYNHLSGDLPVNWSLLNKMKLISLGDNQLTGTLPKSWSSLENLEALGLWNNQLTGNLPDEWKSFIKIWAINISENELTGNLPDSWSSLIKLRDIKLYSNQITGTLPESWSAFTDMMQLMLNNNQLSGSYPESWKTFSNLQYLYLNDNQIADLPELSSYPLLDTLSVENNRLDFGDIEPNISIPKALFVYSPQAMIGKAETITKNIGAEFKISVEVGGTSNIYQWFKDNKIIVGANSAEYNISSVTSLDAGVYTCKITNLVATQLTLTSSPISLQIGIYSPCSNIDSLALVALYNQCNGPNWTKKDNWLTGRLETWQGVTVENCRVTFLELRDPNNSVGLVGQLPAELSNLTAIRCLLLSNNQLSGNLPENWSAFENLESLMLDNNQFTGVLPDSWSGMRDIYFMDLSYNYLSGELPQSWSVLQNLEAISLSHNQFTGLLPESWSALNKLKGLYLNSNEFTGTLPTNWYSLEKLELLWLFDNQLTGKLPNEWEAFKNMASLDLSNNEFSGNLPDSWSSMSNLISLTLNSNQFNGMLPDSWSTFVNLIELHLDHNHLTGSFPESWKAITNLGYLYLNNNQISVLPLLLDFSMLNMLAVENNMLDFGDIEPNINIPRVKYTYSPQANIGLTDTIVKKTGEEFRISVVVGGISNKYQWYKNGIIINGAVGTEFIIPSVNINDAANYTCNITNTVATQLTLTSNPITLQVQNQAFSANAGLDQTVNEGTVVSLDGSLSYDPNGNPLTYKWTVPAGITLSSVSASSPTFIAPEIEKDTTYTFSLVVSNGTIDSPADQVTITVLNVNKAPIANAGIDQSVSTGEIVSLNGSASFDPDGKKLTYKWSAPGGIILSSVSDSIPTFTAPETKSDTIYTFSLIVNDGLIDSSADQVNITVFHADKQLLINAGPDQYVYERTTVHLDGSASTFLNKKPLTYQWICPSDIYLSSLTDEKPSFKAPEVSETTKYTFSLVVNDGTSSSIIDRVNIYVVDEIRIYPNITTGIVTIEFNIAANRETEVLVINLTGTVLLRNKVTNPSKFQLDLSRFADETYVIIVNYDDKHYSCKVILRK